MRQRLKSLVNAASWVIALPLIGVYWALALLAGPQRAFPGFSQAISLLPGLAGVYFRRAFYRSVLTRCDPNACISFGTIFSHPTAAIGRTVYVGVYCCVGEVTLEDDVLVGSHVSIANGGRQHGIDRLDIPVREQPGQWPRITVGRDSWIGDRAIVLASVGRHCVVGAGAVVVNPVPDYAVVVGVPAKVVRYRTPDGLVRADCEAVNYEETRPEACGSVKP